MPTTKKRLNITLSPELEYSLEKIAKRDKVPTASKATELLEAAIEMYEDAMFQKIAEERDIPGVKYIHYKKVFK